MNLKIKILLFLVLFCSINIFGQPTTFWPYSVFGIGDIQSNGFGQSRGMGGTGIALQCDNSLNDINPACLEGLEKSKVIMDVGVDSRWSQFYDGYYLQNNTSLNFNFFSMGFRPADLWACAIGLAPYSFVGTNIITTQAYEGVSTNVTNYFAGTGGINQAFWSNSLKISDQLSIGVNIKYLFGSINIAESLSVPNLNGLLTTTDNQYMSNLIMDYGLLYKFSVDHIKVSLGCTFSNPWTLAIRHVQTSLDQSGDTIRSINDTLSTYKLPLTYGLGIALNFNNKLTLTFDYSYGQWSKAYEATVPNATEIPFNITNTLVYNAKYVNSNSFNFGAEYLPSDAYSASYFKKIKYRFGLRYANTPLMVDNYQFTDMAVTCGFGLPLLRNKLNANLAFEWGHRGNDAGYGLTIENYGTVMVNLTFLDYWFIKRKFF